MRRASRCFQFNASLTIIATSMLALLVLLLLCTPPMHAHLQQNKNYDYLLLVQSWPSSSYCTVNRPTCELADHVTYFTIHGMWPNRFDGTWYAELNFYCLILIIINLCVLLLLLLFKKGHSTAPT